MTEMVVVTGDPIGFDAHRVGIGEDNCDIIIVRAVHLLVDWR